MLRDNADLVIVGAGFAGLVCAKVAAEKGLSVVVLERKKVPGTGLHTTGIIVKESLDYVDVPDALTKEIHGVRLYSPSHQYMDLTSPGYHFLATDTPGLMRYLTEQARTAGAEIHFNMPYQSSWLDEECVVVSTKDEMITCKYLIGSDGAQSAVAKGWGLGQNQHVLLGVEAEYEGLSSFDENRFHCFLNNELAHGYLGWVVPGVGITQVGLACVAPNKPSLAQFTEHISSLFDFSNAQVVARRGGHIPVGGPVKPFAAERVCLLGDAAGIVSPLTAGGIYTALRYGYLMGEAVADHIIYKGADPAQVMKRHYPSFFWKRKLRWLLEKFGSNTLLDKILFTRPIRWLAQLIFFHRKGLASKAAWKELFKRR